MLLGDKKHSTIGGILTENEIEKTKPSDTKIKIKKKRDNIMLLLDESII